MPNISDLHRSSIPNLDQLTDFFSLQQRSKCFVIALTALTYLPLVQTAHLIDELFHNLFGKIPPNTSRVKKTLNSIAVLTVVNPIFCLKIAAIGLTGVLFPNLSLNYFQSQAIAKYESTRANYYYFVKRFRLNRFESAPKARQQLHSIRQEALRYSPEMEELKRLPFEQILRYSAELNRLLQQEIAILEKLQPRDS